MAFLIDTCIFIAEERKQKNLHDFLQKKTDETLAISVITAAELLHGVHRAKNPETKNKRQVFVEQILQSVPVLDFGLITARIYAQIWAELAHRGKIISAHDLQIAATAMHHNLTLITFNTKDFLPVPGLKMQGI